MKSTQYSISNNNININSGIPSERFISNVDEFICAICTDVVKDPVYFQCAHMLCADCYYQLQDKLCPSCSGDITKYFPPPFIIKNLYSKLVVKCNNFEKYCNYTDILSNIHVHEQTCDYNSFVCPDCEGSFIFLNKFAHENSCEKREIFVLRKQNEELNRRINEVCEERDLAVRQRDEGADFRLIINSNRVIDKQVRDIKRLETEVEVLTLQNREKDERIESLETSLDSSYSHLNNENLRRKRHTGVEMQVYSQNIGRNDNHTEYKRKKIWSCCGIETKVEICSNEFKNMINTHKGEFISLSGRNHTSNIWLCCLESDYLSECKKPHTGLLKVSGYASKQKIGLNPTIYEPRQDYSWIGSVTVTWSCCGKSIDSNDTGSSLVYNHKNLQDIFICSGEKK
jgi:hypothetical protein